MARPQKVGLDYFPVDVDIHRDPKVRPVTLLFGAIGEAIIMRLLCGIYREGYAMPFDEMVARGIASDLGDLSCYTSVMQVTQELLRSGFFHEGMYQEFGLLTSRGIQARYEKACTESRRSMNKVPENHSLLRSKPPFTSGETPQSKVKESKVKESKQVSTDDDDDDESVSTDACARARRLQQAWWSTFGKGSTPAQVEVLDMWVKTYAVYYSMDIEVIAEAIRMAAMANADNPISYIGTLLRDWKRQKIKTMDDLDAARYKYDHAMGKV